MYTYTRNTIECEILEKFMMDNDEANSYWRFGIQNPKLQSLIAKQSNKIRELEAIIALNSTYSLVLNKELAVLVRKQFIYKRLAGYKYL